MVITLEELAKKFGRTRRRIFIFVCDNPNCTRLDVELEIYGRRIYPKSNVVPAHLTGIRRFLERWTEYKMTSIPISSYRGHGKPPHRYKIVYKTKTELAQRPQPTGSANVTP